MNDPRALAMGGERWLTDSRVYNLIWLGRWLERANGICHALEVAVSAPGDAPLVARLPGVINAYDLLTPEHLEDAAVSIGDIRELISSAIVNARNDADQVGPLELIQQLNTLVADFGGIWATPTTGGELLAASKELVARLDEVCAVIEERWFRPVAASS